MCLRLAEVLLAKESKSRMMIAVIAKNKTQRVPLQLGIDKIDDMRFDGPTGVVAEPRSHAKIGLREIFGSCTAIGGVTHL